MPEPTPPAPPRIAKLGLAAIAGWWVVQAFLIGSGAGEPYPAILMPSFAGSGGYDHGEVRLSRMEAAFVHAGGETVVSQRRLLEPIPDSHHGAIASLLAPPAPDARPVRDWLRSHLLPGLEQARLARAAGCPDPSLRPWLRARAAALAPGVPVTRVEIRWYEATFRLPSRVPARQRPLGTVRIPLDGPAPCAR